MSGGKHKSFHQWVINGEVVIDGGNRFEYRCERCSLLTLNAEPLPAAVREKCDKKLTASLGL